MPAFNRKSANPNAVTKWNGPGDIVEDKYNALRDKAGGKLWQGTLALATSGLGKGILITAAVVFLAITAFSGWLGAEHILKVNGVLVPTLEDGIVVGVHAAGRFLFSGFGLAMMAMGGALGVAQNVSEQNTRMTADQAKALAQQYEMARAVQLQQTLQPEREAAASPQIPTKEPSAELQPPAKSSAAPSPQVPAKETPAEPPAPAKDSAALPDKSFCDAELARRAQSPATEQKAPGHVVG